ncbi:S-layer homology domain-containing protein [Brachybacterium huguangmaarense]|uniref:S-layer homology domain-containing protein n=1 Tax=Brachybacterium huguangmaarense TaxID=1652028 RepID=A0ABY6G219_9MICO|nr:5'-nucleotidase C-terminal domain-containing protein [Brachybacterium huguangmaarense]UYG17260.1 S-layer homology domain-containing protein [Brachybacterium huguangmaarense]
MSLPLSRRAVRAAASGVTGLGLVLTPLGAGAVAAGPLGTDQVDGTQVTLFNINDFHGRISSNAKPLACTLTNQRSAVGASGNSVFLSAGDNIGASEFASYIQDDEPTIDYLNALGLQASALGNHEYDRGQDDLTDRVEPRADFAYLAANVYTDDGARAATPYTVVDAGAVKVAVVGADTEETPTLVSPSGVTGLDFRDPVDEVNAAIDELDAKRTAGELDYDVLVVEYHEGSANSAADGTDPGGGDLFTRIVTETSPEADVVFNGHTHQTYSFLADVPGEPGETRPIMQTGSYGVNLGQVTLQVDGSGDWDAVPAQTKLVPTSLDATGGCTTDATYQAAAAIADEAKTAGDIAAAEPVGSLSADLTTAWAPDRAAYDADGTWQAEHTASDRGDDRASTSTLSNALADSMVWATQQDSYAGEKATIGVMNPGGVRADLFYAKTGGETEDGVITYGEANNVVPFVNNLSTVRLTGAQFLEVLDQQWQLDENGNVPSRPYLALGLSSNVSYAFDPTAATGERITAVTVDGEPLEADATYTVVAANFLTAGGDNFRAFTEGTHLTDTGLIDRDAWIGYLAAHPDLAPDYSQRGAGVQVTDPDATGTGEDPFRLHITKLESRSLGAPRIDTVTVTVGDQQFTAPYRQGEDGTWAADVPVTFPGGTEAGDHAVTVTAGPDTGTSVSATVHVGATVPLWFSDVTSDTMYHDEIMWLAENGITTGWPDGTFRPVTPVARDAMAEYLYRLAGSPHVDPPRSQPFTDVKPGMEHYDAIIWAYQQGIVQGWPDRTFRPTAPIERGAMAAFVYRYAGSPDVDRPTTAPFRDVPADSQFATEIAWLQSEGITTGWPDGTYRPLGSMNRDATAAFLYRLTAEQRITFLSER